MILCDKDLRASLGRTAIEVCLTGLVDAHAADPCDPLRAVREEDVRIFLATSGSSGQPAWIGLSDRGIHAVLTSHLAVLTDGAWDSGDSQRRPLGVQVSVLNWAHAFGVVFDLLAGLVAADVIMRDRAGAGDPAVLSRLLTAAGERPWFSAVPLTIDRFANAYSDAKARLDGLAGGIVGGAALPEEVADALRGSRVRIGYGMTEAGPGVALSAPGETTASVGMQPVGCEVLTALDSDGAQRILVRGPNISLGHIGPRGTLIRRTTREYLSSDTGRVEQGRLVVTGRVGERVKLPNGRWAHLPELDTELTRLAGRRACVVVHEARPHVVVDTRGVPGPKPIELPAVLNGAAVHHLSAVEWPVTAKGAVDRKALGELVTAPEPEPHGFRISLPAVVDCNTVERATRETPSVGFDGLTATLLERSREGLERILGAGTPVYGSTTGFGPHVAYAADHNPFDHGSGLIAHLASGVGPLVEPSVVRAVMLVRANAIARGYSGVTPATLRAMLDLIENDVIPAVPSIGSVGASGDLIPLSHIARVITGEGFALSNDPAERAAGVTVPASVALASAGLLPRRLDGRDALALVNGTAYSTTLAAIAAVRAERLLERAADLTGWLYASLGARRQAIDPRLHGVRRQSGQIRAAALIRSAAGEYTERDERSLQEVYSIRCAAQVLGPALDLVGRATNLVDDELSGVSDNPVIVEDPSQDVGWIALHGGNFHAAAAATASDLITGAITQVAVLAERQIDVLANPATSQAPLLLASRPGAQAGLAGVQLTASAVLAEIRHAAQWASTMSVPTNAGNQDIVPMAPLAARTALAQVDRLSVVLGSLGMFLRQYRHLVRAGLAQGYDAAPPSWFPDLPGHDHDVATDRLLDAARLAVMNPGQE